MINRYRITAISFLAYFIMSAMLSPIGIIVGPMSDFFDLPITDVSNTFSWLTFGILIGSAFALFVFDHVTIKRMMLIVYGVLSLSLFSMLFAPALIFVGLALGAIGVGCGIGLAGAASVISRSYNENSRASMLVITDACFSIAGIIISSVAIYLIAKQMHWASAYFIVGFVAMTVVGLSLFSSFPEHTQTIDTDKHTESGSEQTTRITQWPPAVWCCIVALFLYTLGQYSMLWWLPNYAETALNADPAKAGDIVSKFWSGMLVTQLFVAWWVYKIGVQRLVIIGALATALMSVPLSTVKDIDYLIALAFIWGVANLGLLKIIISFGSLMIEDPPPKLISAFLFGATSGTAISPFITSNIVEYFNAYTVLQFGSGCYLLLVVLIFAAKKIQPSKAT